MVEFLLFLLFSKLWGGGKTGGGGTTPPIIVWPKPTTTTPPIVPPIVTTTPPIIVPPIIPGIPPIAVPPFVPPVIPPAWLPPIVTTTPPIITPATPPAYTAPPQGVYTIKSGDFPSGLAAKATGDAGRWREIRDNNPGMTIVTDAKGQTQLNPWNVGDTINVPAGWNLGQAPPPGASPPGSDTSSDDVNGGYL